jgi:hypothetical protein
MARLTFLQLVRRAGTVASAKCTIAAPYSKTHKRSYPVKLTPALAERLEAVENPVAVGIGILASMGQSLVPVTDSSGGSKLQGEVRADDALADVETVFGKQSTSPDTVPDSIRDRLNGEPVTA